MNLLRRQPQIRRTECNILIYCHFKQLIFRILERQTNPSAHLLQLPVSSGSEQEAMPLVVFNKTALDEQSEKTNVVLIFVKENFYQQVFANGEYEVYAKDKKSN